MRGENTHFHSIPPSFTNLCNFKFHPSPTTIKLQSLNKFLPPELSTRIQISFSPSSSRSHKTIKMNPDAVKSTLTNLAFGNVIAAAARNYQKELLSEEKAAQSSSINEEVDLDDLMDDPELEKLHADRIAAFKKEAEKREAWKKKGHGEFREVTEGDFLGEVTGSEKVICHFYHKEFYRCKIMDKHLKSLSTKHIDTKFIRLDAENAPFFVAKLAIKTLPCVILFRQGVAVDRLVGFQDLGAKDDFSTRALEVLLIKKGIIAEKKDVDEEDQEYDESKRRSVRSSAAADSDSDSD
ncbi:thioredoxin-like/ATP-binding protein [Medicago truncatula]|uniref:Thioredoxin-like/ATP-binding protein n=2 Tax=Medicago truncatula TaxID=3880 RepID=G7LDV7_MEDTR|nr:thioredoxin-like/ATP-binding protein [Medicago truncatula]